MSVTSPLQLYVIHRRLPTALPAALLEWEIGAAPFPRGSGWHEHVDKMTITGHHMVMKLAKVSELKARLSAYLREVRRGETVVVCDRNTPVARLIPYEDDREGFTVERPSRPLSDLKRVRGVELKRPIEILGLLRESRDQR